MPTIPTQLKMWQELRDALNKTGRPIYTEFCPRSYGGTLVPPNKTTQDCNPGERCINDGPPHEWDGPTRANLANAILTEFGNSHDNWGSAMSNLDALLTLRPQPDVDGPGFFSDGDMLQTCNFGFGGTNCNAARGQCPSKGHMTQDEYTAQFATWAALASQMIISADLRNLQSAQPECFKLLKNADILAVSKVTRDPSSNHASKNCQLTSTVRGLGAGCRGARADGTLHELGQQHRDARRAQYHQDDRHRPRLQPQDGGRLGRPAVPQPAGPRQPDADRHVAGARAAELGLLQGSGSDCAAGPADCGGELLGVCGFAQGAVCADQLRL